jgi:hypothetical protein
VSDAKGAEIHPLPGRAWSAEACLHDALQRAPKDAKVIVIWSDPELRELHYSAAGLKNAETVWLVEQVKMRTLRGDM